MILNNEFIYLFDIFFIVSFIIIIFKILFDLIKNNLFNSTMLCEVLLVLFNSKFSCTIYLSNLNKRQFNK